MVHVFSTHVRIWKIETSQSHFKGGGEEGEKQKGRTKQGA
jgi:hypothetical protein